MKDYSTIDNINIYKHKRNIKYRKNLSEILFDDFGEKKESKSHRIFKRKSSYR